MTNKRFLSIIAVVMTCSMIFTALPVMSSAAITADNKLQFNSDGKFKIMVFADCQDDVNPDSRMINFMGAALDYDKPDLVVFTGDNVVVSTTANFRTGAQKLIQPLIDRNIPYAYVYGNHDDQTAVVTKKFQYSVYKALGNCLSFNADDNITGYINCNLPILSSDGTDTAFNLWMIDSNTYASSGYDNVHQDQLNWLVNTDNALTAQVGHKVNSMMFQHIIVPEAYNLLVESSGGSKTYNGKKYALQLNSYASGYLGEFPCPSDTNSGQLQTVSNMGNVLGIVTGHDHSNSFVGRWMNVDLIQTAGMSFESYGDDNCRGYRTITIDENNTSVYETKTHTYNEYVAGLLENLPDDEGLKEYSYTGNNYIGEISFAAASTAADGQSALTSKGYTVLPLDLNKDAGGDYIYMGYKTTSSYADAIKSIRFYCGGATSTQQIISRVNGNNCTYIRASDTDLNKGAGSNTDYIYGYYTKDAKAGPAITSVTCDTNASLSGNTTAVSFANLYAGANLNSNTKSGSATIYCHYTQVSASVIDSANIRSAVSMLSNITNGSDYSAASYSAYSSALTSATSIISELDSCGATKKTQAQIDSAADNLTSAYNNLKHTVTYLNEDGSFYASEDVLHGGNAVYALHPEKDGNGIITYIFKGWDKPLTYITANITTTAVFEAAHVHSGGFATCSTKAICESCGQPYGDFDTGNHINTGYVGYIPASCTVSGYSGDLCCSDCGEEIMDGYSIPATGHVEVKDAGAPATCTKTGLTDGYHCSVCGTVILAQTVIPQLKHNYTATVIPATCTTGGYTENTCSLCNDTYTSDPTAPLGHSLGEWEITVPVSCTQNGTKVQKCIRCDYIVSEPIVSGGHSYDITVTPPTCIKDGYTTKICSICSDTVICDSVPATGHSFGDWTVLTAPDCTHDGTDYRTCSVCNATETKATSSLGHKYTSVVTPATCTEDGYTVYTCSVCSDAYTDDIVLKAGHSFGNWETVTAVSCTENGLEERICSKCGEKEENVITSSGHDYISAVTAPTCTTNGYTVFTCAKCGDSFTGNEVSATGHSFGSWNTITPVTCTQDGKNSRTCSICAYIQEEIITAQGHKYSSAVTAPTCTENGFTTYTCEQCGDSYVTDETSAAGHSFSGFITVIPATCTENGSEQKTCAVCGFTVTQEITATGHNYKSVIIPPSCTENGFTDNTCEYCGDSYATDEITATGHSFTAYVITEPATCTANGTETRTCTVCSFTESRAVQSIGHSYKTVITAPTCTLDGFTTYTCEYCSDAYISDITTATGHSFGEWVTAVSATCTKDGSSERACIKCGIKETKALSKVSHSYVAEKVEPTCTENGYTKYTCSVCGYSYSGNVTPYHGHNYIKSVTPATCTNIGYTTNTCAYCGDTYVSDSVPSAGHSYSAWTVSEAPSCISTGVRVRTCTVCSDRQEEIIAKTSHTPSAEDSNICSVCGAEINPVQPSCGCCDEHHHDLSTFSGKIACFFCKIRHFFMSIFGK